MPSAHRPSAGLVAVTNAVGFVQLQLWLVLVTEQVLRRARPVERYGRLAPWRHPGARWGARALDAIANSRLLGALIEPVPELEMVSDIRDVVYVSYLVPVEVALPMVPPGLELERLGPARDLALFTFLTFRHGHFGPSVLGPLRRLMPSPVQSNWRIHVRDPRTGLRGIAFVTNAIAHPGLALAARLLTEGMPMHVFRRAEIAEDGDRLTVLLDPGDGSAPDARLTLRARTSAPELDGE